MIPKYVTIDGSVCCNTGCYDNVVRFYCISKPEITSFCSLDAWMRNPVYPSYLLNWKNNNPPTMLRQKPLPRIATDEIYSCPECGKQGRKEDFSRIRWDVRGDLRLILSPESQKKLDLWDGYYCPDCNHVFFEEFNTEEFSNYLFK